MKNIVRLVTAIILLELFTACPFGYPKINYPKAYFPTEVTNLDTINSEYDDINMALPFLFSRNLLIFASNRNSSGQQFDLIQKLLTFKWDKTNGNFSINNEGFNDIKYLDYLLSQTQTTGDEYGPYSFVYNDDFYLTYSSNINGTCDVFFYYYSKPLLHRFDNVMADSIIKGPFKIPDLSSSKYNEGYISFRSNKAPYDELNSFNNETGISDLIFCSDSLGKMDIYSIPLSTTDLSIETLSSSFNEKKELITKVNSNYNDRCPNVCGNFMVFSSDRPGGLGGYDFYYSIYENGEWSEPVNFGAPINSEFDEYRAIGIKAWEYENDVLIFSSNRPGGKGGFDIYYVGIDVMPDVSW